MIRRAINGIRRRLGLGNDGRPGERSARGVDAGTWQSSQEGHELTFWTGEYLAEVPPGVEPGEHYRRKYWPLNRGMFRQGIEAVDGRVVADIGCGPFGSLDLAGARLVIGVDPLAPSFARCYPAPAGTLVLSSPAESLPLLDGSVDVVVCVNALDHFRAPYDALREMHRVLRPGGGFYLATDIGGTPSHPCNLRERDLDQALEGLGLVVVERDCGPHIPSSWPADFKIPVYVFHGTRKVSAA